MFAEWYGPPPRLFVYGAVDTAESLCAGAKLLGWTAIVADARAAFLTEERIPSADRLIAEWPAEALAEIAPDHQTAVVVLTHDDKFDEPALIAALETEAFYIGALGSRRNQERRRERLLEAGVSEEAIGGSRARAASTSAPTPRPRRRSSILSEILAVRAGPQRRAAPRREGAHPRRGGVGARPARQLRRRRRRLQGCAPPEAGIKPQDSAPAESRLASKLRAPSSCAPPARAGTAGAATAAAREATAPRDSPGGETARTRIPVERSSQRSAAFARGACQDDVTTSTSPAPDAEDVVHRVRHVVDRRPGVRVDDDLPRRAAPRGAHQLGLRVRVRHARPAREDDDVVRGGHLRRALQPRRADGVELAAAAVRVAEDDDESRGWLTIGGDGAS